jgi:hypothetical protein
MARLAASLLALAILTAAAPRALAVATPFELLFDGGDVGGFSVDPALAGAVGESTVAVSAFDLAVEVSGFGLVAFTLADVTGGSPIRAVFLDGQLASLTTAGATGNLPGSGEPFFLDITPFVPADPSLIDLLNAGEYNLQLGPPDFPDRLGSIGIAAAGEGPVIPEPTGLTLFGVGLAALRWGRRRG